MKKTLVFAMAMALGVSATAFAANPFSDLPAGHWAYASVAKLAAAGIVDGYPDGSFKGDRTMTRYEMAQIVAKALAKGAIGADDKLVGEFADELDNLGVRVAKLEKKSDNVKIAGYVRFHYRSGKEDGRAEGEKSSASAIRSRLFFNGAINDNWTYTGMLHNDQSLADDNGNSTTRFQRAFLTGKYGNFKTTLGRQQETLVDANVYDDRVDAAKFEFGDKVKFTGVIGKMANNDGAYDSQVADVPGTSKYSDAGRYWRVGLDGKVGKNLTLGFDYIDIKDAWSKGTMSNGNAPDMKLKAFKAMYTADQWKLGADYILGDSDVADIAGNKGKNGYVVMLGVGNAKANKVGSVGLWANYYNQPAATFVNNTFNALYKRAYGFKGYGVGVDYTVAKNMIAGIQYFDLKDKNDAEAKRKTLWSQLVITF